MNFGKTFRKVVATVSTIALVFGTIILPGVQTTQAVLGVDSGAWFASPVQALFDAGAITAEMDGPTFNAGGDLTRADAVRWTVVAAGLEDDTAPEAGFSDVSGDVYVNSAVFYGIVDPPTAAKGNRFFPTDTINRAELTKIETLGFLLEATATSPNASFSDVPASEWFAEHVNVAYHNSVVNGEGSTNYATFAPARAVNKAEGAQIIAYTIAASQYDFARAADGTSAFKGLTNLGAVIAGEAPAYEAAAVVADDTAEDEAPAETPATLGGGLTVTMATYPGTSLPSAATSVPFVDYTFTASGESVTLDGLVLHRFGVSAIPSAFQGYLYEGDSRVTTGRTVNTTTNNVTFRNLNFVVPSGSSRTFTLRADLGTVDAVGEMGFELVSANAIESNASAVNGSFPMTANKYDLTTTTAGSLTIVRNGTVANPKVGEQGVTVSKFKVTAGATEDVNLHRLGVYFSGTLSTGDLKNLELYDGTSLVSSTPGVNSQDVAMFMLETPLLISKGNNKNFSVKADLDTGRGSDTIQAYIDETTDVFGVGATYGFGVSVNIAGSTGDTDNKFDGGTCSGASTDDCTYSTIQGGDITLTSNGPAAQDIATNGDDVVLMNFTLASVSDITVRRFEISLTETGDGLLVGTDAAVTTPNFTDIKIVNTETGATIMGPVDSNSFVTGTGGSTAISNNGTTDDNEAFYLFSDEFAMDAGEVLKLAIMTDVESTAALADDTLVAKLNITSAYPEFRDANNKVVTNTSDVVPGSAITGKTMTIKTPSLTLALSSTPAANTYVKGTDNVLFACFSASAGNAADVKLTDATLTVFIDSDGTASDEFLAGREPVTTGVLAKDIVGSLAISDSAGTVLAAAKAVQTDGTVVFDSMNIVIKKGVTKQLCAKGNISADAFKNSNGEVIAVGITTTTNVTAETVNEGNTVTVTGTPNATSAAIFNGGAGIYQTITDGGSLTVAVDAGTPKENILVAGTSNNVATKFKFTTTDEAFTVNDLHITNRQDGVAAADLGEYDDNVVAIKIKYNDINGVEQTRSGFLTNGSANFSGLGFYIAKDDDEVLTVTTDLNTIQAGADSATFVDFNIGFQDFDATAMGSGTTYDAGKLDADVAATSDLDFGSYTFSDGGTAFDVNLAVAALAAPGASQTLIVATGANAAPANLPPGTLLCASATATCTIGTDSIMAVVSWTDGSTFTDGDGDTVVVTVIDDPDDAFALDDDLNYALPGQGYLSTTNHMHVHETIPTLAKAASSPAGGRTVSSTDEFFAFTIAANAKEKVQMRQGSHESELCAEFGDGTLLADDDIAAVATAGEQIDGSSCFISEAAGLAANDGVYFTKSSTLETDDYISFWIKIDDNSAASANAVPVASFGVFSDTSGTTAGLDNTRVLTTSGTDYLLANDNDTTAGLTDDIWYFFYDIPAPTGSGTDDVAVGVYIATADAEIAGANDEIHLDQFKIYKDRLVVDLSSDESIDTLGNTLAITMKEGGSTVITSYIAVYDVAGGADADDASTALAVFIPTTQAIEIAKGTTKTFTLETNTSTLIEGQSGVDDLLTPSIDHGSSSGGTVTAGDFWWHETNVLVKWLGDLPQSKTSGSTLYY